MTKLSNIVGGLMRDLAQSHSISDAYTIEAFDAYRRDPVLSHLPVPRLSIREAQITLRFAIEAVHEASTGLDAGELNGLIVNAIRERVIPRVLTDIGRIDNRRVVAAFDRRLRQADVLALVDPADLLADGSEDRLVKSSLSFLTREVEQLPATVRRSLEGTDFAQALEHVLRDEMVDLRAAARRLAQAQQAAQGDLDVTIVRESLAPLANHQMSELTLTLTMEDVQGGVPPSLEG